MSAPKSFFFLSLVFFTLDRKSSWTKTFSKSIYYMFCLYHFSVKCIIKKYYLPPYGPQQRVYVWRVHSAIGKLPYMGSNYNGLRRVGWLMKFVCALSENDLTWLPLPKPLRVPWWMEKVVAYYYLLWSRQWTFWLAVKLYGLPTQLHLMINLLYKFLSLCLSSHQLPRCLASIVR